MPKSQLSKLDDAMFTALLDWRKRNGRRWKTALWAAWMNGRDELDQHGASLRRIRNQLGPTWLDKLQPKELESEARRRGIAVA